VTEPRDEQHVISEREETTLTDEEIETRPLGASAPRLGDDPGDDSGDDTGDDSGDTADVGDTGDDSGDDSGSR
jgi:hypothetical protein